MTAFTRLANDVAGITDDGNVGQVLPVDSAGLTGNQVIDRGLVLSDTTGLVEAATVSRALVLTFSDPAGNVDDATPSFVLAIPFTDPAGTFDGSNQVIGRTQNPTDPAGISDSFTFDQAKSFTSPGITSDSAALNRQLSLSDPEGLSDTGIVLGAGGVVNDSAGMSDLPLVAFAQNLKQTQNDTLAVTDTGALLRWDGLGTDSVGVSDAGGFSYTLRTGSQTPTDNTGLTDGPANFIFRDGYDDRAGLTDLPSLALSRPTTDKAGISDLASVNKILSVGPIDLMGISDVPSFVRSFGIIADDDEDISDNEVVNKTANYADSSGLADGFTLSSGKALSATDPLSMADDFAKVQNRSLTFDDPSTLAETDSYLIGGSYLVNEPAGMVDAASVSRNLVLVFSDPTGLHDALDFAVAFSDLAGLSDGAVVARDLARTFTNPSGLADVSQPRLGNVYDDPVQVADDTGMAQQKGFSDASGLIDGAVVEHTLSLVFSDRSRVLDGGVVQQDLFKAVFGDTNLSDRRAFDRTATSDDDAGLTDDNISIRLKPTRLSGRWSFT
jgi:hypothetical protein